MVLIGAQLAYGIGMTVLGFLTIYSGIGAIPLATGVALTSGGIVLTIKNIEKTRQKISDPNKNEKKEQYFYRIMK